MRLWFDRWVGNPSEERFYRYITVDNSRVFIGEAAWHHDTEQDLWLIDIIIHSMYRGRGYGKIALQLLCNEAKKHGIHQRPGIPKGYGTFLRGDRIVFIPRVRVLPIDPEDNARFIKNFLSRDKQKNTTRPFYDKTIALYPELKEVVEIEDEAESDMAIRLAVFKRLADNEAEIRQRIQYFTEKYDSFIPQFIEASCALFHYEWKESQPEIICYVGYIPFYPRSSQDKCFFVSYQDEERVFSGAVHEINHMIFYEKLCEMKGVTLPDPVWPEPLWYLQEIVVDPTLNEPEVRKFTLYDNKAYPQFYEPLHGTDESIMDKVKKCFDERESIEAFLNEALEIVKENME